MNRHTRRFAHFVAALTIVMPGCDAAFALPSARPVEISCHMKTTRQPATDVSVPGPASTSAAAASGARIAGDEAAHSTLLQPMLECRVLEVPPAQLGARAPAPLGSAHPTTRDMAAM